jgi:L-ascorbate metabolism protein UlaG (beta-lactamase superfamily)
MEIQQIRNATLKIKYNGKMILTDPVFSAKHSIDPFDGKERNPIVDLPFDAKEVIQDIDMVIVSHHHDDHFDDAAKELLPKDIPLFCQPGDEEKFKSYGFSNVTPVQDKIVWNNISFIRTEGHHGTGKWAQKLGNVSGFVIQSDNEPVLYWAGDTILCKEVENAIHRFSPNVIITHSGGAMLENSGPIIMDAQQTIKTCKIASDSFIVATHMEAFDLTTVTRDDLRKVAKENKISKEQLLIPLDGEILNF